MRIPNKLARGEATFNLTPLIDVVFQLLIFFLLTGHLTQQESQLPLPLPRATSGIEDEPSDRPRITINVQAQGELVLQGRPVNLAEMQTRLEYEAQHAGQELEVRLRADRNVAYRHVSPVLAACAQAGLWNVSIAVAPREGGL